MIEAILNFVISIFPTAFEKYRESREPPETKKKLDLLREQVAATLVMNSGYYYNPITQSDNNEYVVTACYREGAEELRTLAAKLRALAKTMPSGVKDIAITKSEIYEASASLIGLSNSFFLKRIIATITEIYSGMKKR